MDTDIKIDEMKRGARTLARIATDTTLERAFAFAADAAARGEAGFAEVASALLAGLVRRGLR